MKRAAFTIIEVMFAIVLMSTALLMLSPMQLGSLTRIMRGRNDLQRIYILREKLQELLVKPPKKLKSQAEKREKPETEINVTFHEIVKKSQLHDFSGDIVIARVDGTYQNRKQTLVTFLPKPKQEKS